MGKLFTRWLLYTAAILATSYILPGVSVGSILSAFVISLVLGAINLTLRPLLILLTLPISVLSLGIFVLVINALLVLLTARIVPSFQVDGFGWAFLFAIILSIISSLLSKFETRLEEDVPV